MNDHARDSSASGAQKPTLTPPGENVGSLISTIRSRLLQDLDAHLSEFGLTGSQYPVLRHIADGSAKTAADLCRNLRYDTGSMTRMLDRLEEKGMIERERSPDDRRIVHIRLSAQGTALFPKFHAAAVSVLESKLAGFSSEELAVFTGFLRRMLDRN